MSRPSRRSATGPLVAVASAALGVSLLAPVVHASTSPEECRDDVTAIGAVQGDGARSPYADQQVTVAGVVVGDFQQGGFDGYYVQDDGDGDPATSDGLFVYAPGGAEVAEGDRVQVTGTVTEYHGLTEVSADTAQVCASDAELPAPQQVRLPRDTPDALERVEGMRVELPQSLAILEYFNYDRFGEIVLGSRRQHQPTAVHEPGSTEAEQLAAQNELDRITLDDGRSVQNPDPAIHPDGSEFTLENRFRGGDRVTGATGVVDFRFDRWRLQPTEGAEHTAANPRPEVPEVGGSLQVASFNVLNYFTTLGERGADTTEERQRQQDKIVAALAELDADVVGLMEIENNGTAVAELVAALNEEVGAGTYDHIDTGVVGTDAIAQAIIYRPAAVTPQGEHRVLTAETDERFLDEKNRPALAQVFTEDATGGEVSVVVNHLKSKGSSCADVGDPTDPDGQGNCNGVRTDAARALVDWVAQDPVLSESENALIMGDLNAYDEEDPIRVIREAGYTDLVEQHQGERAYSYVFDGQLGYLDHALAAPGTAEHVTGTAVWHANADEPDLIDYDTTFKEPAQDALYAPDPYRASDHDAVLVGLELGTPGTGAPGEGPPPWAGKPGQGNPSPPGREWCDSGTQGPGRAAGCGRPPER